MAFIGQLPGINLLYNQYSVKRKKRKDYYLQQSDIRKYNHFLKKIHISTEGLSSFTAPVRIKPFGLDFGLSKQEVVQELGKPDYVLTETGLANHQIIYYKKKSAGNSYFFQVHFVKDKMVYAMNRIRDLSANRKDFFIKVTRMVLSKYSLRSHEDLTVIDSIICDEFDNKVSVIETLGLSIRYISGSNDFIDMINSKVEEKKSKKVNAETVDLDNLFMII